MLIRSSGAGCPICGANHASCGPAGTGTPVDIPTRKDRTVGAVRKYHVTHNGHRTIMRLNDQDVKAYPDAQLVDDVAAVEPGPESAQSPDVEADPASPVPGVPDERPDDADPGVPVGGFEPAQPDDVDLKSEPEPAEKPAAKTRTAANKARRPSGDK